METDNRKTTATVCKKPAARKTSSSGKRRQAGTTATLTGSGDIYRLVTDRIIVALENGTPPWRRPWRNAQQGINTLMPVNALTGRGYSGVNVLLLWLAAEERGFTSDRWLTYNQAREAGGQVRKGETATLAVIYRDWTKQAEDSNGNKLFDADGKPQMETVPMLRQFPLFNAEQCDALPDQVRGTATVTRPQEDFADVSPVQLQQVLSVVNATGVQFSPRPQNRAYYRAATDQIVLPLTSQFDAEGDYWSTVLHELVHASGHAKRLNREGITRASKKFGDPVYAFEELIVRRRGANIGVDMIILDSWENPCEPDLPVPVMNRLKSRKGNGTIACQEKAQTVEAIVGRAGHRKMRMVKAKLPEPQSSEFYPRQRRSGGCNVVPCRYRGAMSPGLKKMVRPNIFGPASTVCPLSGGSKGRTGHLSALYLHICVTTGSPKWAQVLRPTWRQSCHISLMPEVMLRTAIFGWMIGNERCRVTGPGVSADQVKGNSVCDSGLSTEGMC